MPEDGLNVRPVIRTEFPADVFMVRAVPATLSVIVVLSVAVHDPPGAQVPVMLLWPCIVRFVLPLGTVKLTGLVQVQEPAGILTVVVEGVTEFSAACTSVEEQPAALIVWASPTRGLSNKSMNDSHFIAMVGGHRSFTSCDQTRLVNSALPR